ncbi:mycothiol synthase [Tersicoccus sp. MR15.9]|uniref:mycothiol synthase n=1 Tax=Tersicoccus mangrovi TaxID=3121635 RepID=UPI002FE5E065
MSTRWHLDTVPSRPTDHQLDELARLAGAARAEDGHPPFSDQTLVSLRAGDGDGRRVMTLLARTADAGAPLAGAAALVSDGAGAPVLEVVVDPAQRRGGAGGALLRATADLLAGSTSRSESESVDQAVSAPGGVLAWSHGDHPAGRVLAAEHGYDVVRELWRMSAPVAIVVPEDAAPVTPAEGIHLRTFRPGDEAALLELNREAFAHHPEQGSLSPTDLADLMAQDWFDADGLFLAERQADGALLGFHWTKIDPDEPGEGEVYVLGVHPGAQGLGLGRVLTAAGLAHLRGRGVETITLYVDADNAAAVRLYTGVGFTRADVDVMYAPATVPGGRQ